jgi:hypothetical protein
LADSAGFGVSTSLVAAVSELPCMTGLKVGIHKVDFRNISSFAGTNLHGAAITLASNISSEKNITVLYSLLSCLEDIQLNSHDDINPYVNSFKSVSPICDQNVAV